MTNLQLQQLVEQLSQRYFHRPFRHQVTFNARLRTTGGRYRLQDHNIEINPKMLTEHDQATLVGVIKHELCHYHLHLAGQSGQHRTRAFQTLLAQVGGLRYAPAPLKPTKTRPKRWQEYVCTHCGQPYYRLRRVDVSRMVCGRCHGKLRWQGVVISTSRPHEIRRQNHG
ncbi:MAG TPA: SprT family protein [Candidatus Levilactobacillus faecigallinarum]|uniref:SprT family protein n=1 Tax=Candidatus Levilactobacillus faecigallinarum TaxID=2838638 RepID=A0A9D1U631_9LACO|nr:SprT family protein [Candidatus Levilactobacillus faecigallinarum]